MNLQAPLSSSETNESPPFHLLREAMVHTQIKGRGVQDPRVLAVMRAIPRERFVPAELAAVAYQDRPLPIGQQQTISQPYMVAVMTELLHLQGDEVVLEIGTGSGYQAAILARLARLVVTVERLPELSAAAAGRWRALAIDNIHPLIGDSTLGAIDHAPFDAICVTAGAPSVPPQLVDQIRPESGRIVIPVGDRRQQSLWVIRRNLTGDLLVEARGNCVFVPLIGQSGWPEFS